MAKATIDRDQLRALRRCVAPSGPSGSRSSSPRGAARLARPRPRPEAVRVMHYALYTLHGQWVAVCRTCGVELARSNLRFKADLTATRRRCPVCR